MTVKILAVQNEIAKIELNNGEEAYIYVENRRFSCGQKVNVSNFEIYYNSDKNYQYLESQFCGIN